MEKKLKNEKKTEYEKQRKINVEGKTKNKK